MSYEKTIWVDHVVPVNAENLNHMEEGIAAAIPSPLVAEVGQVLRVSEIDENGKPVAWEPYSEGDYELLYDKTLTEEAINMAVGGLKIKKAYIEIFIPKVEGQTATYGVLYAGPDSKPISFLQNAYGSGNDFWACIKLSIENGRLTTRSAQASWVGGYVMGNSVGRYGYSEALELDYIEKIVVLLKSGQVQLPIGSSMKVYGVPV